MKDVDTGSKPRGCVVLPCRPLSERREIAHEYSKSYEGHSGTTGPQSDSGHVEALPGRVVDARRAAVHGGNAASGSPNPGDSAAQKGHTDSKLEQHAHGL